MTALTADQDPARWLMAVLVWLPLVAAPLMVARIGVAGLVLLLAAIATYSAGAVCFSRKLLDLAPSVFGYHEVWHLFTLAAA